MEMMYLVAWRVFRHLITVAVDKKLRVLVDGKISLYDELNNHAECNTLHPEKFATLAQAVELLFKE